MYCFKIADGGVKIGCVDCGDVTFIPCTVDQIERRLDGESVNTAFPEMGLDLREMFISGICPKCWNKIFGDVEEAEEIVEIWNE